MKKECEHMPRCYLPATHQIWIDQQSIGKTCKQHAEAEFLAEGCYATLIGEKPKPTSNPTPQESSNAEGVSSPKSSALPDTGEKWSVEAFEDGGIITRAGHSPYASIHAIPILLSTAKVIALAHNSSLSATLPIQAESNAAGAKDVALRAFIETKEWEPNGNGLYNTSESQASQMHNECLEEVAEFVEARNQVLHELADAAKIRLRATGWKDVDSYSDFTAIKRYIIETSFPQLSQVPKAATPSPSASVSGEAPWCEKCRSHVGELTVSGEAEGGKKFSIWRHIFDETPDAPAPSNPLGTKDEAVCPTCNGEGKLWCAMCGKWGNHRSGGCPEIKAPCHCGSRGGREMSDQTMRTCVHHTDEERAKAISFDNGVDCPVCLRARWHGEPPNEQSELRASGTRDADYKVSIINEISSRFAWKLGEPKSGGWRDVVDGAGNFVKSLPCSVAEDICRKQSASVVRAADSGYEAPKPPPKCEKALSQLPEPAESASAERAADLGEKPPLSPASSEGAGIETERSGQQ